VVAVTHVRFDHVGFTVADLDRSVAWYTHFLGAEPLLHQKGWDAPYVAEMLGFDSCNIGWAYFELPGGGRLELIQYVDPAPDAVDMETFNAGNGHICIVVDDIHSEYERMAGHAVFRSPEPVQIPEGPNAGAWGAYLRDPDGISIQLIQPG
jgi:catechol 2,3-dioxygenase-like lactoylglutathione lyase family enzyme